MHAVHRRFIPYQLPIEKGREGSQGMWWIGGWTNKNNACTNKALTILKCSEQNLQKRGYHFACLPPPRLTISICTTRGRALTKKMREAPMILKISDPKFAIRGLAKWTWKKKRKNTEIHSLEFHNFKSSKRT